MELTFLGTSSMVPTKERNVTSLFLDYKGEGILIDCGEGTQRQMNIANINRNRVKKIFISHWHGDHVSGLIGLIQTIGNAKEGTGISIFGPKGTKERINHMLSMCFFTEKIAMQVHDLNPKKMEKCDETEDYEVWCEYMEHSIPCLGYRFVEKNKHKIVTKKMALHGIKEGPLIGKLQREGTITHKGKTIQLEDIANTQKGKILTIIMDTSFCNTAIELARDSDLLICEATYCNHEEEKANEYKHMTSQQAATIASNANAKKLIVTHFSQRYKTVEQLEEEMKEIFPASKCAHDFMKVNV